MVKARRPDLLGLRSAMADRLLPMLVGAMSFLAALAVAGTLAASALATHWRGDAGSALTVQVPDPDSPSTNVKVNRAEAVLAALQANASIADSHRLTGDELNDLLRPWLGADAQKLALPIPAVITGNWQGAGVPDGLANTLNGIAPGTLTETGARWASRVAALTASVQASAASVLLIVALVAAAVVAVATRSGLAQRRESIEIIHGLGALDADIADRFAGRATAMAAIGAAIGAVLALPVLLCLSALAAPFASFAPSNALPQLPATLWIALPALPVAAAIIGWGTAQFTVRNWLRGLA